jgi:hypothetical protein
VGEDGLGCSRATGEHDRGADPSAGPAHPGEAGLPEGDRRRPAGPGAAWAPDEDGRHCRDRRSRDRRAWWRRRWWRRERDSPVWTSVVARRAGEARRAASVCPHHEDVVATVSVGLEQEDRTSVRRPVGFAVGGGIVGEVGLAAAVGSHDVDLGVAVPPALEGEPRAVGRLPALPPDPARSAGPTSDHPRQAHPPRRARDRRGPSTARSWSGLPRARDVPAVPRLCRCRLPSVTAVGPTR